LNEIYKLEESHEYSPKKLINLTALSSWNVWGVPIASYLLFQRVPYWREFNDLNLKACIQITNYNSCLKKQPCFYSMTECDFQNDINSFLQECVDFNAESIQTSQNLDNKESESQELSPKKPTDPKNTIKNEKKSMKKSGTERIKEKIEKLKEKIDKINSGLEEEEDEEDEEEEEEEEEEENEVVETTDE